MVRHGLLLLFLLSFVIAFTLFLFFLKPKTRPFIEGIKVAHAEKIKKLPAFQKAIQKRKLLSYALIASLILSLLSTSLLMARPFKESTLSNGMKKRDIFLCMDVSYSLYALNSQLVDHLQEVVASMEGDRFGISMFNTSSILYVPLTDDYDFVIAKLEELKEYFALQKEYQEAFGEYTYIPEQLYDQYNAMTAKLRTYDAGTLVKNHFRGSSLIGEGLASCLYSFPHLDDESRTRVIILSTDNAQMNIQKPIVELDEAANLCLTHDVHLFGIFPDRESYDHLNGPNYDSNLELFTAQLKNAEATVYEQSSTLSVEDIVKDIQKNEAMIVKEITVTKAIDQPQFLSLLLLLSLLSIFFIKERMVRK
ncbi:MAG: hypothetical protein IJ875_06830 [Solobacterium sp.]|nr:hypothetical protein [Solobacterium sp.]